MKIPENLFKSKLLEGAAQYGLWLGLGEAFSAEICAGAGFDWLLIDAEHGPNDLRSILVQLQAIAPYKTQPIVRPPHGDHVLIKQLLETGVQTLLVPMVESASQAADLVSAMRYPPIGIRGVGSALARASRWGRIENYADLANEQMCLLVQVETKQGYDALEDIVQVEGVDGVFFGNADLAASYGYLGKPSHPEIVEKVLVGLNIVRSHGKAGGVLCGDKRLNERYREAGANFIAVGADAILLSNASTELRNIYKPDVREMQLPNSY